MYVRKTRKEDLSQIAEIYKNAKKFMKENGNPTQWRGDYPNEFDAEQDIEKGIGYVCVDGEDVVGVFAFIEGVDPTYVHIYDGAWLDDKRYAAVHRIATLTQGKGVAKVCFDYCFQKCQNLKIDTHEDNLPMQKALIKNGFQYCGVIYLPNGEKRIAYQKNS